MCSVFISIYNSYMHIYIYIFEISLYPAYILPSLGVASALRVHMGYIAGLVPGTKAASTCQVDAQGTHSPHARCGSGPIISITSEEDRRLSLGLRRKESSEPRVNFSLPPRE